MRLLSVAIFLLVIISGLLGKQAENYNFAPTLVWIVWWVSLSFFTAFVGSVWPLVDPWGILFEWAGMAAFGKDTWLRGGEAFSIFFGVLGRFAPTEVGGEGAADLPGVRRVRGR